MKLFKKVPVTTSRDVEVEVLPVKEVQESISSEGVEIPKEESSPEKENGDKPNLLLMRLPTVFQIVREKNYKKFNFALVEEIEGVASINTEDVLDINSLLVDITDDNRHLIGKRIFCKYLSAITDYAIRSEDIVEETPITEDENLIELSIKDLKEREFNIYNFFRKANPKKLIVYYQDLDLFINMAHQELPQGSDIDIMIHAVSLYVQSLELDCKVIDINSAGLTLIRGKLQPVYVINVDKDLEFDLISHENSKSGLYFVENEGSASVGLLSRALDSAGVYTFVAETDDEIIAETVLNHVESLQGNEQDTKAKTEAETEIKKGEINGGFKNKNKKKKRR